MDREELIKKLEQTEIPEVELVNHKNRLKIALLSHARFEEQQEVDMNPFKTRTTHIIDTIGNKLT